MASFFDLLDEPLPPATEEELAYQRAQARRFRPHCGGCGRWISPSSRRMAGGPGPYEVEEVGRCGKCGPCTVSYPE